MSVSPKAAWIGSPPAHWEVLEPRRLFGLRREPEHARDVHLTPSQVHGVIPQARYMEITGSRVVQNLSGTAMQHVEPGDFISHLRTFQGGLELSTLAGKVSPAYTVLTPTSGVEPRFYRHALKSSGYISQIASVTDQLRDGQSMRYAEFNQTWLPRPPLAEQRQIADYLDHETAEIDAFIADLGQLVRLELDRVRSYQEHMIVTSAPTITLRRLSPTRISGVSVNASQDAATGGQAGVLKTSAVSRGYFRSEENKAVVDAGEIERLAAPLVDDRVLVNRANTPAMVGSAAYVGVAPDGLFLSDKIWSMDFAADNEYVWRCLQTRYYRDQVELLAVGASTSMQNLGYDDFLSVRLPVPAEAEQRAIVNRLRLAWGAVEAAIADIDAAIALAKERRAALITAAVTGQIDVAAKRTLH